MNKAAQPGIWIASGRDMLVIVYLCSLPGLVLNFFPLLVSAMVASFGLSEPQSGFIASADMAGYTAGTVAAFLLIRSADWRALTKRSLVLMLLANLLCAQVEGFGALLAMRFLSGVGGGMLTATLLSVIAQMRNPEAVYGLWFALMSLITVIGVLLFPQLLNKAGLGAAFTALAALLVVGLPFVNSVPRGSTTRGSEPLSQAAIAKPTWLVVASIFVLTAGIGSAWAFLGQIGAAAGLSVDKVSHAIAISAVGGIIGGIWAGWLDVRLGRRLPINVSCAGLILTMLLLHLNNSSYALFAACSVAFYGLWSFVLPYLLGAVADAERSGRALSLGCTAQGGGFMVGPFLASLILYVDGYGAVLTYAAASVLACLVLFAIADRSQAN